MNEQRAQAYVNLIEQLLTCADGEEPNILQANQELIDPQFLQVMENYAADLEEQGNNNPATWLRNMAQQLGQYLKPQPGSIEEYQAFLSEVLQAEYESNDPAVVYPVLKRRQHLLDDTFAQLLQQRARNVFSQWNAEEVAAIAGVIQNLCNQIAQFSLGSRANNLEIAITGYYTMLEVYTREAFPEAWAMTQNNLGVAYGDRIRGERADNLELAITAYNLSLEVYTREAFPEAWAMTQNNLGVAYGDRIRGERADNLELAIAAYNLSLEVLTREAFLEAWARTQNNLGNAYLDRIRGEKTDNLELAITAYNLSLEVLTREAFPEQWATEQNNLGNAYLYRIRGERADNLELAIVALNLSLEVRTREAFPYEWARTQNNLGEAYRNRIRGERANNLELAIAAYNLSLEVYTRDAFSEDWARTQNNLGNAYCQRIKGDILENLQMASTCYQNALTIYTREDFPEKWNEIQNNLVKIYYGNIQTENFDKDQQFQQAYFDLIQSLLLCPKGEEDSILESHVELIDIHLIEMMKNIANLLQFYGRKVESNWLQFTSDQLLYQDLAKRAGFSDFVSKSDNALSSTHIPDYLDISDDKFLMEVLHRIEENPDPKYVYPLLEKNISRLNYRYLGYLLENWANHEFSKVDQTDAQDIALVILNFGVLLNQFEKGNKESNQELAILAYNIAENIFKFENCPKNWAVLQYNLGNSYIKRIKGNKAENLEQALIYYQQALKVYNNTSFPNEWASTQINISSVYKERFKDDRADNIEKSIECLNNALQIFNRNNHPYEWGITQLNLSGTYLIRIKGDFYKNLDYALVCCQNALEILTIDHYPYEYAEAQYNLGSIYQNNINKSQSKNIEKVRKAYESAAQIFTYENYPYQWAATQEGLALVYLDRIQGDKLDDLNQALEYSYQALRIYTPKNLVYEWANIQETLGDIYSQLTDDLENVERAIVAYQYALRIFTLQAFPRKCYQVNTKLGHIYFSINNWKSASEAYNLAIETVENIRLKASNPQRQQEILSEAMDVYHGIVQSYLNLNQPDRALEYVERSKTRYLVQLLTDRDIYPKGNIPQTIITELDRLRRAIIGEEQRLAIQEQTRNRGEILTLDQQRQAILPDYTHLNQLKQLLNQFIDREITKIDEDFILTQTVKPMPFQDILSLTDAETCLLQWYITDKKILAFVVSADGNINVWESSEDDRNKLTDLINNYLQLYYSQNGHQEWINQLSDLLQTFSDTLHINDILALIPNTCKRLIIIPYLFLHILPLHALPINDNQILQDKYDVQYAPSCQLFKITQQRQLNDLNSLFAIQNPQNNLLFTDLEVEIIKNLFIQSDILAKQNATETAIKTHQNFPLANCIHFSCHGTFNPDKPLESALILTKNKTDQEDGYLRLGEIFELNFKNCRLVMLSACETGLIDPKSISDEYIGLPSGFLFAGSPSVVSSLWKVNDLSTAFLLIKFYETLPKNPKKGEIAVTLKNAQKWLQTLTLDQFEQQLERFQPQLDTIINQLGGGKRAIFNESLKQIRQRQLYPFKNPYYWAGFIATGF